MTPPPSRKSAVKWNLLFQYATIGISIISGVIMVPIYLAKIPIGLYGAWLASGNILNWLTTIDPGLSTVLQREISCAYGKGEIAKVGEQFWSGVIITLIIIILFTLCGSIISPYALKLIKAPAADFAYLKHAFLLQILATSLLLIAFTMVAFNSALLRSKVVGIISVIAPLAGIATTVYCLYSGKGLLSLPYGSITYAVIICALNAVYAAVLIKKENIPFRLGKTGVMRIVNFLSFTYFGRIAGIIYDNFDLMLASRYLGPETVTILNLTKKAPEISRRFVERPATALIPSLAHLVGEKGPESAKDYILRFSNFAIWGVSLCVAGFIALNDDFVRLWVGPSFFAGVSINLAIVVSFALYTLANTLANLCFALGDIKGTSLAISIQTAIAIPTAAILTYYFGMIGLILGGVIPLFFISLSYYVKSLLFRLHITHQDAVTIFFEFLKIAAGAIIIGALCSIPRIDSWYSFALMATLIPLSFAGFLALTSTGFNKELILLKVRLDNQNQAAI